MFNQKFLNPRWRLVRWCTENNWFWYDGVMKEGTTLNEVVDEVNRRTRDSGGLYRWDFVEFDGDAEDTQAE